MLAHAAQLGHPHLMEVTDLMLMEAAPPQIQCPF